MLDAAIQVLVATLAVTVTNALAIVAIGRSLPSRLLPPLVSALFFVVPFAVEAPGLALVLLAHVVAIQWMRVVEVARAPDRFARRERLLRVLVPLESRAMTRSPRSLALPELAIGSAELAIGAAVVFATAATAPAAAPYTGGLVSWGRWLGLLAGVYVGFDGALRLLVAGTRPFGLTHEPAQRQPIVSRTLAELWGVRWNRIIGRWLRENVFEPCARRRLPRVGIFATFLASAAFHFYVIAPATGPEPAAWVGAFFLVHGVAVLVEAKLGVRRWRPVAGRAFTLSVFVLTAPLIAEGFLRALDL